MLRRFAPVTLALLLLPAVGAACSMCQGNDPAYRTAGVRIFSPETWRVALEFDRLGKDQVAEGDPLAREREHEERLTLAAAWTPRPWLRLEGRVPAAHRVITAAGERAALAGLADPELSAHVRVAGDPHRWAAVTGGVRAPWGANERSLGGVRAEEHLQPGTGALSGTAGVAAAMQLANGAQLYASALGRTNATNDHGYRYGGVFVGTLAAGRELGHGVTGVLELNARSARADREDGLTAENTGGRLLYVAPRIQAGLGAHAVLNLGVQVPVWQDLLGDQDEHANLLGGVSLVF